VVSSYCPEHSLVLRSYSKIATPGIRLGLVSGPHDWINALIKVKQCSDLHSSIPMQAVLLGLLQNDGFSAHLDGLRTLYGRRYEKLMEQLTLKLPSSCQVKPVLGGMFIWLTLPACDVVKLAARALENGVAVVPGSVFYQTGEKQVAALRLNFTNANLDELTIAVDRLVNAMGHVISE